MDKNIQLIPLIPNVYSVRDTEGTKFGQVHFAGHDDYRALRGAQFGDQRGVLTFANQQDAIDYVVTGVATGVISEEVQA